MILATDMSVSQGGVDTELLSRRSHFGPITATDFLATLTVSASFVLSLLSLFWPWGSSTQSEPLSSNPDNWLFVLPVCVVLGAASVMVLSRTMRSTVFNICALSGAFWGSYLLSDVVHTIQHQATLGIGAKLALGSLAAACLALPELTRPSLVVTRSGLVWSATFFICAVGWGIAYWGSWTKTTTHVGDGLTWKATHTADLVQICCSLFGSGNTVPDEVGNALLIAVIVAAAVVLALCLPGWVSGTSIIALGVLFAGATLVWIYDLSHDHPNPSTLGLGLNQAAVNRDHITATVTGLWNGSVGSAAVAALIMLGLFRLLASFIQPSDTGRPVGNI